MNKLMMTVAIGGLAVSANAVELSLKSDEDSVVWDFSSPIWKPRGGGDLQTWANGDNSAYIGTDFTGSRVTLAGYMGPKELCIENAQTLTLTDDVNTSDAGLSRVVQLISKYGAGELILDYPKAWRNYTSCDWHIYGGRLRTGTSGGSDNYRFADISKSFTIYLHDGSSFWQPCHNFIAYRSAGTTSDGVPYEDLAPSIHVYTNATLHVGTVDKTIDNSWSFLTVMDVILDGGTLDLSRRGSWGQGYLKVNRRMAFKGTTPYVMKMTQMDARLELPKTRLLEFEVDDITGDSSVDVTLSGVDAASGFFMGPKFTKVGDVPQADHVAGFKKTGSGTMWINQRLYLTTQCSSGNNGYGSRGLVGIDGDIRVEAGVLRLAHADNTITGKIEVVGGTLEVPTPKSSTVWTKSCLGDLSVQREIIVSGDGVLTLPRNGLGSPSPHEGLASPGPAWVVARDGGTIRCGDTGCFDNLWLDGGSLEYTGDGEWPHGFGGVLGTWKFSGSTPYVLDVDTTKALNCQQFHVNNNSQTTFDVADITGDAAEDVTFKIGLARNAHQIDGTWQKATNVGFRKIGAGTMCCNFYTAQYGAGGVGDLDGTISVEEGTLQVDGGLVNAKLSVAEGAFVSGIGSVAGLTLADGAGFVVKPGQAKHLSVSGAATIAGAGVVDIIAEDLAEDAPLKVAVVDFNGALTGSENLSGWKVRVNGVEIDGKVLLNGKTLMAKRNRGMMLIFR